MKVLLIVVFLVLLPAGLFAGVEDNVQYIRDIYRQTNEEIDNGELYRTIVDINVDGLSYPAVGTYHPVLTLYFGFSEEEPYPDNLRKAILVVDRAAYHEYSEFLYDGYGDLIFVYVTGQPNMPEMRFYYHLGELIKIVQGSDSYTDFITEQLELSTSFQNQGASLENTFQRLFY
ncbi:MAG: hypothetical protein K8S24_06705 [Candidatus Aegiribacteria sp.]|nr:hypothetical protein [Candidatus Aegiribacteria sp.]